MGKISAASNWRQNQTLNLVDLPRDRNKAGVSVALVANSMIPVLTIATMIMLL